MVAADAKGEEEDRRGEEVGRERWAGTGKEKGG